MTTLNAIEPTPEQIKKFLSDKKAGEPVYMLNLLKFKDKATYKNGENVSGREAYARYASAFSKLVKDKKIEGGGTWGGNMNSWLIGQGEGEWDAIGIFKYPSAEIMIETVSSDEYRKIHKHRRAGLEGQLLISCDNKGVF
ncbi:MAG: DUF1330 domain-containing protein [Hellea sp.]|jgi:uncharacterized protein (DUF1330 family)|nr:DUF1330 domain-containing protein [Hellea sp.]MDG1666326.1 DUF1330 domain-containing protein [Hellea sp.]MDG2361613.1 DUF1330 domain-containing protein [Hellea sp.]